MQKCFIWVSAGLFALVMSTSAFADGKPDETPVVKKKRNPIYLNVDLGYAHPYYGSNGGILNFISSQQPNLSSHIPIAADISGLFGVGTNLAVGFGVDVVVDEYNQNTTGFLGETNAGEVTDTALVGTLRYSLGSSVLSGVYVRGDLGVGFLSTNTNAYSTSTQSRNGSGFFMLGGAGYALQVSPHAAIRLEPAYSKNYVSGGSIGVLQITGGLTVLF